MEKRQLLIVAATAAVVLFIAIWIGARPPALRSPAPLSPEKAASENKKPAAPDTALTPKKSETPKAEAPAQIAKWEMQIDQALRSTADETQTAQMLINLLPTLPPEGQVEASHHISNLLPDENYKQVMPFLLNPAMPEEVLSVFFTDLMNRGDSTKLPALLEVAKIANHPFHDEAMSTLQIFLGDDYGNDWNQWNAAMQKYLAQQQQLIGK